MNLSEEITRFNQYALVILRFKLISLSEDYLSSDTKNTTSRNFIKIIKLTLI